MKYITLTSIFCCLFFTSILAQSKMEFGLTAEGSWFMPGKYSKDFSTCKDVFGAGIGVYLSQNIYGKLSADIGLMYRYKEMQVYNALGVIVPDDPNGGYGYGNSYGYNTGVDYIYSGSSQFGTEGWKKIPLNYIVLPVHLNYLLYKSIFARGGIEASFLTNNGTPNEKTGFNWTVGVGCRKYKVKGSVNYVRRFKDEAFTNVIYFLNGDPYNPVYRNNMIQLSLSYPLWEK